MRVRDVFLCARGLEELEVTGKELQTRAVAGQKVFFQSVDISNSEAVTGLVAEVQQRLPHFVGLVNNAGVYGPKGRLEDTPWDEWAQAIAINLFGTALPCRAVLPIFRAQRYGKIVNLSGGGATAPLPFLSSYAASKGRGRSFDRNPRTRVRGLGH